MAVAEPDVDHALVRISRVASRYLIFDIDDVMFLRRHHNLCSVFSGTVPQNPQQNVFMGLPVELMAEEAKALVEDGVAYVVEDADFHLRMLKELTKRANGVEDGVTEIVDLGTQRDEYLSDMTQEGTAVMQAHLDEKQALREASLLKVSKSKKNKKGKRAEGDVNGQEGQVGIPTSSENVPTVESAKANEVDEGIFGSTERAASQVMARAALTPQAPYAVTPTTTGPLLGSPDTGSQELQPKSMEVEVPPSYALFKHLHDKGYYMMPGLRFGCDYNVYPGDPLRFHAHFQATSYGWDEEINMMDLTAGGRLGTGVKKGWLVGGGQPQGDESKTPSARVFCLEWAGM